MRIAWQTGWWHWGQVGSEDSHTLFAHSMQNKLCPQGTSAATTSFSAQTMQSRLVGELRPRMPPRLPNECRDSVGDAECEGEGRDTRSVPMGRVEGAEAWKDQILDDVIALSKDGDSPRPSSRSTLLFQMLTRSFRRPPVDPEEELEHDPADEKAPELPVELVSAGKGTPPSALLLFIRLLRFRLPGSRLFNRLFKPGEEYRVVSISVESSKSSVPMEPEVPVRTAM